MTLEFHAVMKGRGLDVALDLGDNETVAILGPNGAGKSSVLAAIAGLIRPDVGYARLDGNTLFDVGRPGSPDVWRSAHRRGTALLAQDPLLFPHLSVLDNVAFAPRSAGASRRTSRETAAGWLEEVDAAEFGQRKPAQLSGGQAQRIAVARALAANPRLLLLDEPMSALDVAIVPPLRQMLRRVLRDRAAIIVTHEVLDALLLADRVIVIEDGSVVEDGPTKEVLGRPRSPFAARIAGLNLVAGAAGTNSVRSPSGMTVEGIPTEEISDGEAAVAVFSPSAVAVHLTPPGGSPRNVIPAAITEIEPMGDRMRIRTSDLNADITATSVAALDLAPGSEVLLVVKASEVSIYKA
ncbi:MAG: ATP-binding cassette domain-containing protein [Aeromicrobium sp.]